MLNDHERLKDLSEDEKIQRILQLESHLRAIQSVDTNHLAHAIIENFPNGMVALFDPELRYQLVGGQGLTQYGLSPADFIGKHLRDVLGEEVAERDEPLLEAALRGETTRVEVNLGVRLFRVIVAPVYDAAQRVSAGLVMTQDITDERQQRERIAHQAHLLENISEAVIATDAHFRITTWNAAAERLYGWTRAEALGQEPSELLRVDYLEHTQEDIRDAFLRDGVWKGDLRHVCRDGRVLQVQVIISTLWDERGQFSGTVNICRDVSALREMERSLKSHQARLLAVINSTDNLIWSFDREYRILTVNKAFRQLYSREFGSDLHPGMSLFAHIGATASALWRERYDKVLNGEQQRFEVTLGDLLYDVALTPIRQEDGSISGGTGFARDVTEERRLREDLNAQRARFEGIFTQAADGIAVCDVNRTFTHVNDAARRFAWSEPQGSHLDELRTVWGTLITDGGTELPREQWPVERALRGEIVRNQELKLRHPDGTLFVLMCSTAPLRDLQGAIVGTLSTFYDFTERHRAEEHSRALETERTRSQIISQFVRDASHEFRNPLSVVISSTHLLSRVDQPERKQRYVDRINDQVLKINQLLEALETVSRLDGTEHIFPERLSLSQLINATLNEIRQKARDKQQTLALKLSTPVTHVDADPLELPTALKHLIDNAICYSPEGGAITIQVEGDDQWVRINVIDNGPGIDPEHHEAIFHRFFRVDDARTISGFGLGLSIAQRIAQLHGGDIDLTSAPGQGARFTLRLPVSRRGA